MSAKNPMAAILEGRFECPFTVSSRCPMAKINYDHVDKEGAACNFFGCNCDCCFQGCAKCGGICASRRRRQRNLLAGAGYNATYDSSITSFDNDIEQCDDLPQFLDLLINSPETLRKQISRYHCKVRMRTPIHARVCMYGG